VSDGGVQCWGSNYYGELGNGTTADLAASPPAAVVGLAGATAVSARVWEACALLGDGTARCWGENDYGQLGNGTSAGPETCHGLACSTTPVAVAGLSDAIAVSVGYNFACALLSGGTVKCWGDGTQGQLGNGAMAVSLTPVAVAGLTAATAIATGDYSACALLADGSVACWGDNTWGVLGNVDAGNPAPSPISVTGLTDVIAVSMGHESACAVTAGGSVECWGLNPEGQLGDGTTSGPDTCAGPVACSPSPVMVAGLADAIAVSVGSSSACALLSQGTVQCWGDNSAGDLGNGTTTSSSTPVVVSRLTGATAISVDSCECALVSGGTVKCWGNDNSGQLGDGTTTGPETCSDAGLPCSTTPVAVP